MLATNLIICDTQDSFCFALFFNKIISGWCRGFIFYGYLSLLNKTFVLANTNVLASTHHHQLSLSIKHLKLNIQPSNF